MRVPFLERFLRRSVGSEVAELKKQVAALPTQGPGKGGHEPLLAVARALRDATDIQEFADPAMAATVALTGADRGALVVKKEDSLVVLAARGRTARLDEKTFALSRTIAGTAAHSGEIVATGRAAEDERFRSHASVARLVSESVLALPLKHGEAVLGCVYLEAPAEGFSAFAAETLVALVDLISVGLVRLGNEGEREQRAKLQAIGLAAAAIAHDLRSPLTSTLFALSTLTPDAPPDERALTRARGSCFRARELAEGLVALATGRRLTLNPKSEKLAPLIEEYLLLFQGELSDAGIAVRRELEASVRAHVDRKALQRVLDNLIRNAERAMSKGGRLTVGCGAAGPGKVAVWIADSGPGMTRDQLERAFRLSEETLAGGLGLVVVRRLVDAMEGIVDVDERYTSGTKFTILLPRATSMSSSGSHRAISPV